MRIPKKILFDVGLFLCCLAVAGAALLVLRLTRAEGAYAVVYRDGAETARYPLGTDCRVTLGDAEGGYNVLVIRDGTAYLEEADCPDKLCVRQRAIRYAGETIVCLPHRLMIEIVTGEAGEVDF